MSEAQEQEGRTSETVRQTGWASARTRRVSSGAAWEPIVGYSRAVAAGDYIFVSGCTSIAGADFVHPGDAYAQTVQAIANVESALAGLGASLADVVRTRMFVTDIGQWKEYGRAHGEAFADVGPATSMVQIGALIDSRMLVEVEAVAYKPGAGEGTASGPPPEAGLL
jgi:enamine deaminase RidA (YjgF/YER057c/UK114 family)